MLNSAVAAVVARLGHFDSVTVADAGLPIPAGPQRIDLVVRPGLPSFLDGVRMMLEEQQVQEAIVAAEMEGANPQVAAALRALLGEIPIRTVPHEEFKRLTAASAAVVRTGECSPYANVILVSGVIF
ncbi:MAG: D-ribose pyranase [Caldilineaceae bacterium]